MCVKINSTLSPEFTVTNGVKQGGILSPVLFTIYIDGMFTRLKHIGVGCHIDHKYVGALGYADDTALLAPSVTALKLMLNICKQYGAEYNISFNAEKYHLLHFSCNSRVVKTMLYWENSIFMSEETAYHLGIKLSVSKCDVDLENNINKFNTQVNGIISIFNRSYHNVKYKLFKTYCMPLYGAVLWDFSSKMFTQLCVQWRKAVRKLLNIPYTTHSKYLPLIVDDIPFEQQLYKRFVKFLSNVSKCKNEIVNLCYKLMLDGSNSVSCKNLNLISNTFNINRLDIQRSQHVKSVNVIQNLSSDTDFIVIGNIKDLLYLRDIRSSCFKVDELNCLLEYFCNY
jgi:hypothetical protein